MVLENGDAITGHLITLQIPSGKPCLRFWVDNPANSIQHRDGKKRRMSREF
jgi:hypothetical protein